MIQHPQNDVNKMITKEAFIIIYTRDHKQQFTI